MFVHVYNIYKYKKSLYDKLAHSLYNAYIEYKHRGNICKRNILKFLWGEMWLLVFK